MEDKSFFGVLRNMEGIEAEYFPMDELLVQMGRDEMNARLIQTVEEKKPDLLFCFLFTEEIKKETIEYITKKTKTKTFNWFGDDHWRFPVYSRFWASLFTFVATTDARAFTQYRSAGILNVIKTQWAANPFTFKPQDPSKNPGSYNITFFGQKYGNRGGYIDALTKAGLSAKGHGRGWPAGGGVREVVNYLKAQTAKEKIFVIAEGGYTYGGFPASAFNVYFQDNPNFEKIEVNDDPFVLPKGVLELSKIRPVYVVFNRIQNVPKLPMTLVAQYQKGVGDSYMRLYKLNPSKD